MRQMVSHAIKFLGTTYSALNKNGTVQQDQLWSIHMS